MFNKIKQREVKMLNHYIKVNKGKYTLITNNEQINGNSYLDVLTQLVKRPIPIKFAKLNRKSKFDWIENQLKGGLND
tara:strand:- start:176 stop:406 length:231 start_codon:yes stop_codon:yes gene_type:complete